MREILFRGKEIRRGHWKYGNLIMDYVGIAFRPVIQDIRDAPEKIACSYLVNPDTIGQYMANDMNGNRIFEGDIVSDGQRLYEAVFIEKYTTFTFVRGRTVYAGVYSNSVEVVGNRYDNPELIEKINKQENFIEEGDFV